MEFKNLLDVSTINDKTVDEFKSIKKYVATGDIQYNQIVNYEEVTYDTKPSRANRAVEIGDILVAKMKETVKVFKITKEEYDKYIFSTGFSTLKAKNDILDEKYFYFVLISEYFQQQKNKYSKGATQKAINNTGLKKIKIPVPTIKIQKQIVEILDEAQKLLDNRKKQIKLLEDLIESIFYDMFGDPVLNNKGWETNKLDDNLRFIKYGVSTPPIFEEKGECFIRATNIDNGRISSDNMKFLSKDEQNRLKDYKLNLGYILIVRSGVNAGDSAYVTSKYVGGYAGYDLFLKLNKNRLDYIFLSQMFQSNFKDKIIKPLTRRAAQPHINAAQVKGLNVIIPPINLQNQFAEKVGLIESQKQLLEDSLKLLEDNYNSIMQRAFKGQLF